VAIDLAGQAELGAAVSRPPILDVDIVGIDIRGGAVDVEIGRLEEQAAQGLDLDAAFRLFAGRRRQDHACIRGRDRRGRRRLQPFDVSAVEAQP